MKFRYKARTKEGDMQVGHVEAGSRDAAANILQGHNLYVLSIEAAEGERWYDRLGSYFRGVRRRDMVIFTRQLATLLEAHLPLNEALKTLGRQITHPVLKETVVRLSDDIDAGLAFSQALARQSAIFSEFFVSMVRSAEATGNLDEVTGFLADYHEKEYTLITKARSAMMYPATIVGLFVVVAGLLVTMVIPQLKPVFEEVGVDLPLITRILIGTGDFVTGWWFAIAAAVAIIIGVVLNYVRTPEGRALWDEMKLRAPILSKVFVPLAIARFSNAASILLRGGVPVAQAMEIVSHTADNVLYRDLIHEAAEAVRQGETLSQALSRHPDYFPELLPQMLAVGETTGQLDKIFERVSNFYNREADKVISNIVDLIQPLLMICIGGLVGLLFASILMPIYEVVTKLR